MMKDLTHYFVEPVKASDSNRNVSNGVSEASSNNDDDKVHTGASNSKRKRGRVKIKISQENNKERVCNIIESNNDLVDKTPSPYTVFHDKEQLASENETPKRLTSGSQKKKSDKLKSINETYENNDMDSSMENIFEGKIEKEKKKIYIPAVNGIENSLGKVDENNLGKREESNAFKVLMTRGKPVQYIATKQISHEEEINDAEKIQESKIKAKQIKEKLITLADKKGYTKRKLADIEEGEKINQRLEDRAKMFKKPRKDEDSKSPPNQPQIQNQRTSIGSLHNYFSKLTPEEREKQRLLEISTLVVKAEIHGQDIITPPTTRPEKPKSSNNKVSKSKTRKVLAAIDDIQVLRSETPSPPIPVAMNQAFIEPINEKPKKPKWSLRINLSSNDLADNETSGDEKTTEIKLIKKSKVKNKKNQMNDNTKSTDNELMKKVDEKILPERKKMPRQCQKKILDTNSVTVNQVESIKVVPRSVSKTANETVDLSESLVEEKNVSKQNEKCASDAEIVLEKLERKTSNEKLAPLFLKRPKPDPEVVAARRRFLNTWSPENPKKKTDNKIAVFNGVAFLPFPKITHVTQLDLNEKTENPTCVEEKLSMKKHFKYIPKIDVINFKSISNSKTLESQAEKTITKISLKPKFEDILQEIELRCQDARDLWQEISNANNHDNLKINKKKGRKRKEKNTTPLKEKIDTTSSTWTYKYRPLSASQIVGNEAAAAKLKNWLDAWRKPSERDDYSSGDDFYLSDNSVGGLIETSQVAVLLGPHGSGKTASVYAIAEELGYKILELNASSQRRGKRILKEFEEATQSHRIKKSDSKTLKETLKKNEKIPHNSLILVEDVDLIFDEDEGFISAICQLASNTKRPIVLTCRGVCSHLSRMAPQQVKIYFSSTPGPRVSALLELITLTESGNRLPKACLDKLLTNGDLRQALLQLQYLLLSGIPSASGGPSKLSKTFWQDMRNYIYKPAIKIDKKQSKRKEKSKTCSNESKKNIIEKLAQDLDAVSIISSLIDIDDPAIDTSRLKFEASLSLSENTSLYSRNDVQSKEIAIWLRNRVFLNQKNDSSDSENIDFQKYSLLVKEKNMIVDSALSQVTLFNLDSQGIVTDYLPAVRTICRSEEIKLANNMKRGNRFFHYLSHLKLPATSTRPEFLTAACKVMCDKEIEKIDS